MPAPGRGAGRLVAMEYVDSLLELIGNTPLVRLDRTLDRRRPPRPLVLAKVEYLNPGGSVKDRIAVRMIDAAEAARRAAAGRHDRRADLGQHRRRPRAGRPAARLPLHLRVPRQGQRGQAATCCGRTAPRSSSARPPWPPSTPTATTASPTGWCARRPAPGSPTSTPTRTTRARTTRTTGPEIWRQTDGRITHFVAGHGHRRHDQRRRAATSRSRTPTSRSSAPTRRARCTPAAPGGPTSSRASARTSGPRPTTARSPTG